jgi:hypothetical protein
MRFSTGTSCSEQARCFIDPSLGLHPRDCSRTVWLDSPDDTLVSLFDLRCCRRPPKRTGLPHHTFHEVWHPSGDISVGVRFPREFHPSAPSVHVLSQHFDGLLLQPVCPSFFIRAPPMGFKELRRTHQPVLRVQTIPPPKSGFRYESLSEERSSHGCVRDTPPERNARRCFQPEYLASRLLLPMPRRVSLRVFDRPYIPSA